MSETTLIEEKHNVMQNQFWQ